MITVTLQRCPDGYIRRFIASGHSGLAAAGQDIICSAVSAIAQTVIGSLQDLAGLDPEYRLEDGHIECQTLEPAAMSSEQLLIARTLMASMAVGCRQIENSYGSQYVKVQDAIYT